MIGARDDRTMSFRRWPGMACIGFPKTLTSTVFFCTPPAAFGLSISSFAKAFLKKFIDKDVVLVRWVESGSRDDRGANPKTYGGVAWARVGRRTRGGEGPERTVLAVARARKSPCLMLSMTRTCAGLRVLAESDRVHALTRISRPGARAPSDERPCRADGLR